MNAVVLAGAQNSSPITDAFGVKNKAFIPINGKPMIQYILEVLKSLDQIKDIVVVGPMEDLGKIEKLNSFVLVPEKGDIVDNVKEGFRHLSGEDPTLILTSDIPMITREALEDFISKSHAEKADFYYPIIKKEYCEDKYPGVIRTFVHLDEGSYTGGNIFIIDPLVLETAAQEASEFIALRKKPHMLALKLGPVFILKFMLKKLGVREAEKRVSQILKIKARAVRCSYPEIGTDVDKETDLELVKKILNEGKFS